MIQVKILDTTTAPSRRLNDSVLACVNYTETDTPFSDCFSPMAISPARSDAMGIHRLFFKGQGLGTQNSGIPALQPALRLCSLENGRWIPVYGADTRSRVDRYEQSGLAGTVPVEITVFFSSAQSIELEVVVRPPPDCPPPSLAFVGGVGQRTTAISGALEAGGLALDMHVPWENTLLAASGNLVPRLRISPASGTLSGGFFSASPTAALPPVPRVLRSRQAEPADNAAYFVRFGMRREGDACRAQLTLDADFGLGFAADKSDPRLRWKNLLDALPDVDSPGSYWKHKQVRAAATLISTAVQAPGYGNFSDTLGSLASAHGWASTCFFWDHAFSSIFLGSIRPEWQTRTVQCHLQHALTSGRVAPGILTTMPVFDPEVHAFEDCYAPIFSWAVRKAQICSKQSPELEQIYPYLKAFNDAWFNTADRDGDGIPEWRNTGNPADDSPLYDRYAPETGAGCFQIPPFPAANLCAYLLMDCRVLEKLAGELGRTRDARHWQTRAEFLDRVLIERMWNDEDKLFYDLTPGGEQCRVRTFFGLLPLWAGVGLPVDTACAAIEQNLLNPDRFNGEIPLPSVAYDEPTYNPDGYWRGRCWPHIFFWNVELLHQFGFENEAEDWRQRFLNLQAYWNANVENWSSHPSLADKPGVRNYNWGAAACYYFLAGWHRQPVGAEWTCTRNMPATQRRIAHVHAALS